MQKNKFRIYFVLLVSILFVLKTVSATPYNEWDIARFYGLKEGRTYKIDSGTGFFINSHMVVTNRHVVTGCYNIAIRGAVPAQRVQLYAVDNKLDLAILRTVTPATAFPYIRTNYHEVHRGDVLFSAGYPLERGESGKYLIKSATVMNVAKDNTGFSMIEFTNNLAHGNSGGPLLDKNSNIVGVVTGKLTYYSPTMPELGEETVSMAIGIDGLTEFLARYQIPYSINSSYDMITSYNIDDLIKQYVVNIHCVKE